MTTDYETERLRDLLTGYLVGALHGMVLDVEWHHDGNSFVPAFTVTNPATKAQVVIHIDAAV